MNNKWQVITGNNIDVLKTYEDNTYDSIITDPPYGIAFLGKDWDSKKATETTSKLVALQNLPSGMKHTSLEDDLEFQFWMRDVFLECNRVLKPGGYLLAFSAARTYHHMAMAAQTAGFEIRDQLQWIYSSGFPKAQDIGKAIDRRNGKKHKKPDLIPYENKGAYSESMGAYRGRCPKCLKDQTHQIVCSDKECVLKDTKADNEWSGWKTALKPAHEPIVMARKPFSGSCVDNVLEWGTGAMNIDESRIDFTDPDDIAEYKNNLAGPLERSTANKGDASGMFNGGTGFKAMKGKAEDHMPEGRYPSNVLGEIPEYQKYFYCPKVSRKERQVGYDVKTKNTRPRGEAFGDSNLLDENKTGNNHPTVKPVELMKYLIKLVTPAGGRVLDPFNGSGSTGMAAVELGYEYVGCELDPDYAEIARTRIKEWERIHDTPANSLFD